MSYISNRVRWAKWYLIKAGLLQSTKPGSFLITEKGIETLNKNLEKINIKYLVSISDSLKQSRNKNDRSSENFSEEQEEVSLTPEEAFDTSYKKIHEATASEIIERICSCSSTFFEKLVVELLVKMGYGGSEIEAAQVIGGTGDEGIDGIIKEDKLGLDVIYIQAKKWQGSVGRPEVQKFCGALAGKRAKKGIFITPSVFSKGAEEYVNTIEQKIILIDGERLANLMIDYNLGVKNIQTYEIKRIDSDYFTEEL
jgi:restriction system protein